MTHPARRTSTSTPSAAPPPLVASRPALADQPTTERSRPRTPASTATSTPPADRRSDDATRNSAQKTREHERRRTRGEPLIRWRASSDEIRVATISRHAKDQSPSDESQYAKSGIAF